VVDGLLVLDLAPQGDKDLLFDVFAHQVAAPPGDAAHDTGDEPAVLTDEALEPGAGIRRGSVGRIGNWGEQSGRLEPPTR
jgi:hypothetical protein